MSSFITALIKQRKDAKKAEPSSDGRLKEIIAVLKKYNYDDGITPEITVNILQDLGPTFVKIGQIASQQAEYLPAEYCDALAKLHSEVAPMDIETVNSQIEKYLGKTTSELFKSFDDKPLGSASIAQVHKAELFDGTVVAVKVRRPGIVETVARDFALIEKILDKFLKEEKDVFDIRGLILELENTSKIELDLTNEADNLDKFWKNNAERERIESPKCYREYTCEAILTESFVTGKEVSDTEFLATLSEEERDDLAALLADNFASQILTDGFYHADPHSGNVLIKDMPSGDQAEQQGKPIEWIDFGMMGILSSQQRRILIDLVTNVVMQDAYKLKLTVLKVAKPKGEIDHAYLIGMCEDMCSQYSGTGFGDFALGDLLGTILDGLQVGNFKVEPFLTNLARGIIAMEGTIKTLSKKVNILDAFTDKLHGVMDFNINLEHPEEMNPDIALKLFQLSEAITNSSNKTAEAYDMLEKGQIKVGSEFSFEDKTLNIVNRLTGYLVRALVIVALIIGSSILCTSSVISEDREVISIIFRAVGFVGFVSGALLAFKLCKDVKKGK
ncbi:MAG: hypothetical protein K5865_09055 [Eubacterium sp.]|nr:hypothetical protein [Eubacterium sp.]